MAEKIVWEDKLADMSHLVAMYDEMPWSFEETVARILAVSGQDIFETDQHKTSFEARGQFKGIGFSLYDYKEDSQVHIGSTDELDVDGLIEALTEELTAATPEPYEARTWYGEDQHYCWPPDEDLLKEAQEVLHELFEQCAIVHKNWGENCNRAEANAAIERGRALLKKLEER